MHMPFAPHEVYGVEPPVQIGRILEVTPTEGGWHLRGVDVHGAEFHLPITPDHLPVPGTPPRPGQWWAFRRAPDRTTVERAYLLQEGPAWEPHHPWSDPSRWQRLRVRFETLRRIRQFFYDRGYLEVDTPLWVPSPGMEPYLDPFITEYRDAHRQIRGYLPYSPEYGMKKLLAMGFTRIFQIAHAFRNGEWSRWHEPEFLLLEWYRSPADYRDIMTELEALVLALVPGPEPRLQFQGRTLDLTPPWPRRAYHELVAEATGMDPRRHSTLEDLVVTIERAGLGPVPHTRDRDTVLTWLFLTHVEPQLPPDRPVFVVDYPPSMAALARIDPDRQVAERFELYMGGLELANGFTELTDPDEQERRFVEERHRRRGRGAPAVPMDPQFLFALRWGMPPAGGVALGVDRLIALLTDARALAEVLPLPTQDRFGTQPGPAA